jgi:hypothetical protein
MENVGQIDEISQLLGSMQADIVHIRRNTELTEAKMDKVSEGMIRQDASIRSAHKRIDELEPIVDDYQGIKQKGIGALTIIGAICGFVGALVGKIISLFFA